MILVEDMSSARRSRGRHRAPPPVQWADLPPELSAPRERRAQKPVASPQYDDRFEQLVDTWFGPEQPRSDDPWRRSA
jgi:hypothetical protein